MRNARIISRREPEEKAIERQRQTCEDNIKVDFMEQYVCIR
jgi:hypothetical protein